MSTPDPTEKPYCDLVMKGGITSGVVYPKLIAKLAEHYRFKSVGGTSAGAIAAAACVAAEFGRRQGVPDSFQKLAQLPKELGATTTPGGASMLLRLFQPSPALRKHFDVLLGSLNKPDKVTLFVSAIFMLLRKFNPVAWLAPVLVGLALIPVVRAASGVAWWEASAIAFLGLITWLALGSLLVRSNLNRTAPAGWAWRFTAWWLGGAVAISIVLTAFAGLSVGQRILIASATAFDWALLGVLGMLLAAVFGAVHFFRSLLKGLHANHWGVCGGLAQEGGAGPGLTEWMHQYFNGLAGMNDPSRPLTFGDLWAGAPLPLPVPPHIDEESPDSRSRTLDLQVMTSAISQNMCYALPWRKNAPSFYFDPAEWRRLFPASVVDWLERASEQEWRGSRDDDAEGNTPGGRRPLRKADGTALTRLPSSRNLPIIVAVRMSLSFPILLSAVPLYAVDFSEIRRGEAHPRVGKRVWFSDGGISSNMPLHFFDSPLPTHPTFAVNLKAAHPSYPIQPGVAACSEGNGRVYLPDGPHGLQRYWAAPPDEKPIGVIAFLASMVTTMQNWRDEIQFPYPGYRDRIVQISQKPDEGGLNLNMPPENIDALSEAGECAAEKLLQKFLLGPPASGAPAGSPAAGWAKHQEIRLRTFIGLSVGFVESSLAQQGASWRSALGSSYSTAQINAALAYLKALQDVGTTFSSDLPGFVAAMPRPHATVKIVPKI